MDVALPHVYWIGGSPCAGKSSIADAIAAAYGFAVYRCDDAFERYAGRADPLREPVFSRLARLSCDGLWMRPIEQQVREEIAFYREEFPMILDDLKGFPTNRIVIAEGAALLPELIGEFNLKPRGAIWIVPTAQFQLTHYARRDWTSGTLASCSDPGSAWRNWMERDIGFAEHVRATALAQGAPCLVVDGSASLEHTIATVKTRLQING